MNYTELVTQVGDYCENSFPTDNMNVFIRQAEQRIYNTAQPANLRKNVTGALTTGNKYLQCPSDFLSVYSLAVYPYNSTTATGTSGALTIVVASTTGIAVGQQVTGTGIGTNAVVRSIASTTITLTVVNSGTVSGTVVFQGDYLYLLNKDVNFIREAYPLSAVASEPKHYAIFGPQSNDVNELTFIVGPTPSAAYNAELHYNYYPESIVTATNTWLGDNFDSVLLYGTICEALVYMKGEEGMVTLAQSRYVQAIALYKNLSDGKQRADAYRDGQVRVAVS
tara:strand:- start:3545 stop:4384 length:840 start_codon:yes stop_codon:yes gene_type:complete